MDYIQKTEDEDALCQKVCDCIKNAYIKYVSRADEARFIFKPINDRLVSCSYRDILFFETDLIKNTKRIILHTKRRQYSFYGTISKLLKELPKGQFIKCHKSTIVNIESLTESCREDLLNDRDYMVMSDGTECNVAIRKRKELLRIMDSIFGVTSEPLSEGITLLNLG